MEKESKIENAVKPHVAKNCSKHKRGETAEDKLQSVASGVQAMMEHIEENGIAIQVKEDLIGIWKHMIAINCMKSPNKSFAKSKVQVKKSAGFISSVWKD